MSKAEKTGKREFTKAQRIEVAQLLIGAAFGTLEDFEHADNAILAVLSHGLNDFAREAPAGPAVVGRAVQQVLDAVTQGGSTIQDLAVSFVEQAYPPAVPAKKTKELVTA